MKKLIKKSILNGIIRTLVTIIYTVLVKFKNVNIINPIANSAHKSSINAHHNEKSKNTCGHSPKCGTNKAQTNESEKLKANNIIISKSLLNQNQSGHAYSNEKNNEISNNKSYFLNERYQCRINESIEAECGNLVLSDKPSCVEDEDNCDNTNENYYYENDEYSANDMSESDADEDEDEEYDDEDEDNAESYYSQKHLCEPNYNRKSNKTDPSSSFNYTYLTDFKDKEAASNTPVTKKYCKIRVIFLSILLIIGYVSLNNYLIMFVYYKSSTSSAPSSHTSDSLILSSMSGAEESARVVNGIPAISSEFFSLAELVGSNDNRLIKDDPHRFSSSFLKSNPIAKGLLVKNIYLGNNYEDADKKKAKQENTDSLVNVNVNVNRVQTNKVQLILIDPQDITLIGLNLSSGGDKRHIVLPESYFDEELNSSTGDLFMNAKNATNLNSASSITSLSKRLCVHPKLNPYDKELMQFVKKEHMLKCNPKRNWISVENGRLRVSKSAIKKHGTIVCAYIPLYRGSNDFSVYEGNRIFPVLDKMPLITDFFKIDCRSKDGTIYSNIHSGIAYESSLHMRHVWNPLPKKALGYNVLMFGFDSVSRMSWIRMLPKSYEYMIKEGFIVLKGYNIVGGIFYY
jgi:hypothetical protein